jgi:hypothetical protein
MKPCSSHRISLEQSRAVGLAWHVIGREAFVFGMPEVLGKDRIECLYQHQRRWRIQRVCSPVMDIDVRHPLPRAGSFSNGPSSVIGCVDRFTKTGDRAKLYGRDLSRSNFRGAVMTFGVLMAIRLMTGRRNQCGFRSRHHRQEETSKSA